MLSGHAAVIAPLLCNSWALPFVWHCAVCIGWSSQVVVCLLQVRYAERGQREDEWLSLDRTQFGWLSEPGPGTNPTFHVSLTPVKDAAVDHAVCAASRQYLPLAWKSDWKAPWVCFAKCAACLAAVACMPVCPSHTSMLLDSGQFAIVAMQVDSDHICACLA